MVRGEKTIRTAAVILLCGVFMIAGAAQAQQNGTEPQPESVVAEPAEAAVVAQAPASEPAVVEAAPAVEAAVPAEPIRPDTEGIIKNLPFMGEIVDFLRLLGSGCEKNIIPSSQVRGQIKIELFDVTFREALDAVLHVNGFAYEEKGPFIFVYTQKEYAELQAASRKTESRVFKLNYIPAADVEALIKPLLSDAADVTTSPEAGKAASDTGEDWAVGNVIIVVDYPERLEQVKTLIDQVDRRPAQVLVEATILVASVSDTNQMGIDFTFLGGVPVTETEDERIYGITSDASTDQHMRTELTTNIDSGGLSLAISSNNVGILIRALESITDVVTLGNPKVLTLNRQQGKVIVGNRDGYITTEVSQTTATQTVEFLETGTQLSFRPFVMDDGYIRMELNPKDSDGGVEVQGNFTLPSETTAEVTTNVLVKDGHTIVIGGLFRDRTSLTKAQVPFLGNVPVVGQLFRSNSDINEKEEVIFLITPHIVEETKDYAMGEKALADCRQISLGAREGMLWNSRERLAMAHYHWAKEKQGAGDLESALWNATMANSLSPSHLDSRQLREELLGEQMYRGESGCMRLFMRQLIDQN